MKQRYDAELSDVDGLSITEDLRSLIRGILVHTVHSDHEDTEPC